MKLACCVGFFFW